MTTPTRPGRECVRSILRKPPSGPSDRPAPPHEPILVYLTILPTPTNTYRPVVLRHPHVPSQYLRYLMRAQLLGRSLSKRKRERERDAGSDNERRKNEYLKKVCICDLRLDPGPLAAQCGRGRGKPRTGFTLAMAFVPAGEFRHAQRVGECGGYSKV
ncbi:hypothetical protein LX32DRAFT_646924 [Colletotrichum zoysiae]|uniref:Uncharacterized protein n=1 Tax=Colletotrichum zoysiae TaxID=1216348 RepID=A0AAD9LTT7_9PEZI|nr:hypothetical protein LX32DRAFT_646924 [Colletotrichum zoysiae]